MGLLPQRTGVSFFLLFLFAEPAIRETGPWTILWAAPAILAAEKFEKSIPLPRSGETRLGWKSAGCTVRGVSLQNYPNSEDIEKARHRDPDDKSWLWWNFHVENRGDGKCRIHLWVDVYDKAGRVAKSSAV